MGEERRGEERRGAVDDDADPTADSIYDFVTLQIIFASFSYHMPPSF
jgi:hypothetical protein